MQRIYNILETILGTSKQGYYDRSVSQYQFNCPYCAEEKGGIDGKYNFEVSLSLGKFHCWSCNNAGSISKLIKKYGTSELLQEYYRIIADIKESKYYDLSSFNDSGVKENNDLLRLPKTFTKIGLIKDCPSKLKVYLEKRNITQDIVDRFQLGYTTWDEEKWQMRNRLIVPSYDINGLNYWVGRNFDNYDKKLKYMNCKSDKNQIVYQDSQIQWDGDITLVEGGLDALFGNNTIGLLGKVLTRDSETYRKLKEKANGKVIICLDSDTTINETKRLYKLLNTGRLKGKIWYIRLGTPELPYKDYGEIYEAEGKEGIIKAMKQAEQFSEIELVF